MKRTRDPWMPADAFGRSIPSGVGLNLLTSDLAGLVAFCTEVLGAATTYADEDFAVLGLEGSIILVHADHTYDSHPMHGIVTGVDVRGQGAEIRVYGADPDVLEERARDAGFHVLAGSIDKPHGLRECYIVGPDGYVFVPSRAI